MVASSSALQLAVGTEHGVVLDDDRSSDATLEFLRRGKADPAGQNCR